MPSPNTFTVKMPTGAQIDQMAIARPRVVLGNQMDTHVGPATIVCARPRPKMKRPTRNAMKLEVIVRAHTAEPMIARPRPTRVPTFGPNFRTTNDAGNAMMSAAMGTRPMTLDRRPNCEGSACTDAQFAPSQPLNTGKVRAGSHIHA